MIFFTFQHPSDFFNFVGMEFLDNSFTIGVSKTRGARKTIKGQWVTDEWKIPATWPPHGSDFNNNEYFGMLVFDQLEQIFAASKISQYLIRKKNIKS